MIWTGGEKGWRRRRLEFARQVMEAGPTQGVADAPLHRYTIALTAASPVIGVDKQQELRERRQESIAVRGVPASQRSVTYHT